MPDTALSAALKEAYASAGVDEVILHTLELWHASFTVPVRVVRDNADRLATPGVVKNLGQHPNHRGRHLDRLPLAPPRQHHHSASGKRGRRCISLLNLGLDAHSRNPQTNRTKPTK